MEIEGSKKYRKIPGRKKDGVSWIRRTLDRPVWKIVEHAKLTGIFI